MFKKRTFLILFCFLIIIRSSLLASLPEVVLKPGHNEIMVNIVNKGSLDLAVLQMVFDESKIPAGFRIDYNSVHNQTSNDAKDKKTFLLSIEVQADVPSGEYKIPFSIKDAANHSWAYTLDANMSISLPENYELSQNYPNPFNSATQIKYSLTNSGKQQTQLIIFDILGKRIKTLINEQQAAGNYTAGWDGTDDLSNQVPSGVYFYQLTSGTFMQDRKMLFLK